MTTNAKIGHGTLFQMQGGSPLTWTSIAEVTSITPPSLARDAQEATHTESTDGWREFIAGLKDGGEVSIEMNFIPGGTGGAATARILSSFAKTGAAALEACRILFPDGVQTSPITATIWAFSAIVTGFSPAAPVDGKMTATATFKLSGKPTFTPAV